MPDLAWISLPLLRSSALTGIVIVWLESLYNNNCLHLYKSLPSKTKITQNFGPDLPKLHLTSKENTIHTPLKTIIAFSNWKKVSIATRMTFDLETIMSKKRLFYQKIFYISLSQPMKDIAPNYLDMFAVVVILVHPWILFS